MSDELPNGWAETTLGEICSKPQYGWTCSGAKTGRIKYVRTTDISDGGIDWDSVPYCEEAPEDVEKYRVTENDIFVSRAGSVGVSLRITDVPCDAVFASYLIRFKPLNGTRPQYVEFFLKSDSYWRSISEFSAGIAVPNVNATKLASLELPLAPLGEQRRIVAKLTELLGKVDASQQRLAKIPVLLKRFRQSVLAAACSGRLTADWREQNPDAEPYPVETLESEDEFPANWSATRIGSLINLVTSGSRGWAKYYSDSGSTFIRAQNINSDFLNLDDIAFVRPPVSAEGLRTKVQQHDILITITGANVTKSALVEQQIENAFVSQHVALVRLKDKRLAKFLFHSVVSPAHGRKQLQAAAYGQGKPGLNLENIRDVVVVLPPLPEQQEIVRRVEGLFALADQLEVRLEKARSRVSGITPSLLARAFAGKLAPQDPTDEPAEKLLERIKSKGESYAAR
jgi:type I restriction enzyme, S subunit